MRNSQEKSKWKKFAYSPISLGFLALVVLFFAFNVIGFVMKMKETGENRDIAQSKLEALKDQKAKLEFDIERLSSETGVEETIRDKFGLVKEGEDVIVIVEEKPAEQEEKPKEDKGFFSFIKNIFD